MIVLTARLNYSWYSVAFSHEFSSSSFESTCLKWLENVASTSCETKAVCIWNKTAYSPQHPVAHTFPGSTERPRNAGSTQNETRWRLPSESDRNICAEGPPSKRQQDWLSASARAARAAEDVGWEAPSQRCLTTLPLMSLPLARDLVKARDRDYRREHSCTAFA